MKINVNRPKPVKLPPTTVDLMGLSLDQLTALRFGVGLVSGRDAHSQGISETAEKASALVFALFDDLHAAEKRAKSRRKRR